MSRLWAFESENAKVYDLNPTDLANFVKAVEMFKADLAAQTRTPPHYLLGQVVNASGDALKVAEAGLVSKCRRKILFFSDPWEEAVALALGVSGLIAMPVWGRVLDRHDPARILAFATAAAAVCHVPLIFIETPLQLVIARAAFGLSAAVFTSDLQRALRVIDELDVGVLHLNSESAGADPHVPFGGAKDSGIGPKEQGQASREFFTTTTTAYVR